jgi:Family of unknown function (DUF6734)
VFLWRPLPAAVTAAPIFAQNPETFRFEDQSLYRLDAFVQGIERFGGRLPEEWHWYAKQSGNAALCCGIFDPCNQRVWPALGVRDNILVEQYFLSACLQYHQRSPGSPYAAIAAGYLFDSSADAFDPECAARAGYTHLIGDAKNNRNIAARLEQRVRSDYPEYYERCRAYLAEAPAQAS